MPPTGLVSLVLLVAVIHAATYTASNFSLMLGSVYFENVCNTTLNVSPAVPYSTLTPSNGNTSYSVSYNLSAVDSTLNVANIASVGAAEHRLPGRVDPRR